MEPKDFTVLHKTTSGKFKPRSVWQLRVETAQLEQERRDMELRLQELRVAMSREKEERKKLGAFRWKSAHVGSVTSPPRGHAERKENSAHKFSLGRMKVRVLKQEPEEELRRPAVKPPRPPLMPPPPIPGNVASSRKSKLRGKPCGQCETRAAGLMCAECGEDYCVGCFARFHQKGALKHHRMIPVKMEIHTSISTLDVLSRFRRQIDADETSAPVWEVGTVKRGELCGAPVHEQSAEVRPQEGWEEMDPCKADPGSQGATLLCGEFDEEESARSFQEALKRWRQVGEQACSSEQALPASREASATQSDLTLWRPSIQLKFQDHGLSYMERLLVKKHRRSPVEEPRPPPPSMDSTVKSLDVSWLTDEDCPGLTAEEMDMKRYCTSLFTAPAAGSCNQLERPIQSSLSFEEMDERGMVGSPMPTSSFAAERGAKSKDVHEAQEAGAADLKTLDSRNPQDTIQTLTTQPSELDLSSPKTCFSFITPLTQTSKPVLFSMTPINKSVEADLFTETTVTQSTEVDLSFRTPVTQSPEHVRSFSIQMTQSPEPDLCIKTPVAQSAESDLSSTTSVTQSAEQDLSFRTTVTSSPEPVLPCMTPVNQSPEPVLSFPSQLANSPETDLFLKTPVTQSLESHLSLKAQMSQSLESNPPSRNSVILSPEPDVFSKTSSPEPVLASMTSVVQSPEPDGFSKTSVTQSPKPVLISMPSVAQSLEPNLSFRISVVQSPEPDVFSETSSPEPVLPSMTSVTQAELDPFYRISATQSSEPAGFSKTSVTLSPKPVLISMPSVAQSLEPNLSSRISVVQSPEPDVFSKTSVTPTAEPDPSYRISVTQSLEPETFSETSMTLSPELDPFHRISVTQSPEPVLSCRTQMAQSPEPSMPSGCRTMRSEEVGQISAKFPRPQPPLSAPCGPAHSPRPPFRLCSAPALRSRFSAGESCSSLETSLSDSWRQGGAGRGGPGLFNPTFDLASSTALGDCSDLASWSEPDAGPGVSRELSKDLCSPSYRELTQLDWNPGRVPVPGPGAGLEAPCGLVDCAAETGPGLWLIGDGGLQVSQPLSPSFSPPLSPPQYPRPSSWSLSMSLSLPRSPSPHLSRPSAPNLSRADGLSRPRSPPLTRPLTPLSSRPWSRAAQEIQDIQGVDSTLSDDHSLEEEADRLALARLEEELRRMSAEPRSPALGLRADVTPCDPQLPPPWQRTRRKGTGSARLQDSEDDTDDVDEVDGDRKSVSSLR